MAKIGYPIKTRSQMKTITVCFVKEDDVEEVIVSRKEHERLMRQKQKQEAENIAKGNGAEEIAETKPRKRKQEEEIVPVKPKKAKYVDDLELALAALENGDVDKVSVSQPTMLFDEEEDVSANKIYNFDNHTPRKNHTKLNIKSPAPNTPNHKVSNKENNTPRSRKPLDRIEEEISPNAKPTPYKLRKRVIKDIKKIQKILENSDQEDFSASESDFTPSSDEDEADEEEEEKEEEEKEHSPEESRKPARRKNFEYAVSSDNYFESQGVKKTITSNNTLKKLKTPKLTQQELDEVFSHVKLTSGHKSKMKQLLTEHAGLFNKWEFILKQKYNIVLYGVGSKKKVVTQFTNRFAARHAVVTVNGFFPNVTVKDVTDKLCAVLKIESDASDVVDRIESKLNDFDIEIYIAIHNVDGMMLRNRKAQVVLSRVAKLKQVRVIATIDHINAPLIWDKSVVSDFNWIWFDCTSYLNYTEEIVYEGNIMLQQSGQLTLASLRNVFNSLTTNSRSIFMIILKDQISKKTTQGMSFRELYQECRRELLVSSDVALRSQLKEFFDHMILKQKRSGEGEERFAISMDNSILKQFLEEQEPS